MPRQPTGRPRDRPRGTGQLENPTRLTVWLSSETYARLEAYADGRHYHRGDPQLSACVRELLEHALACPYKNQTQNIPVLHGDNNRPIENVLTGTQNISEQIETITASPENNYYQQIETVPLVTENVSEQIENVPVPEDKRARNEKKRQANDTAKVDKAALVARLRRMRAGEMNFQQIADQLNAEGLSTLSGRGQWQKGTVAKLLTVKTPKEAVTPSNEA